MRFRHCERNALWALIVIALSLPSCQNAIVFTTSTQTGIELNAGEGGRETVKVGYDRFEGVIMPLRKKNGQIIDEAYPIYSRYEFKTGPLLLSAVTTTHVSHVFATGEAALQTNAHRTVDRVFRMKGESASKEP